MATDPDLTPPTFELPEESRRVRILEAEHRGAFTENSRLQVQMVDLKTRLAFIEENLATVRQENERLTDENRRLRNELRLKSETLVSLRRQNDLIEE